MTLRPTAAYRWVSTILVAALAGGILAVGFWDSTKNGQVDPWPPAVLAIVLAGFAFVFWNMRIQADDSEIVVRFGVTRRYDRRDLAAIRGGGFHIGYYSGSGHRVRFVRADGTVLFTTYVEWWGTKQMEAFARYLGVPLERY